MVEMNTLVFDMDGTIVNLYNVKDWVKKINSEDVSPYEVASPLYDMNFLNSVLLCFKNRGWRIAVTTWSSKTGSKEFNKKVRKAKIDWLKKNNFPFDEIHVVKYGTLKSKCTAKLGGRQILIDDNEKVRKSWKCETIDAKNRHIVDQLIKVL